MSLQVAAFYLFSLIAIGSALMVVIARNPVRAVLFLILAFFSGAGLFVLMGAEFLAMLLVVVYVGAVAVLFLFVVMMLDVDFAELKQGFLSYAVPGAAISIVLAGVLVMAGLNWRTFEGAEALRAAPMDDTLNNVEALGMLLYDDYVYFFQAAGLVLLVAMIGAIVLTLRHRDHVKRQKAHEQVGRTKATGVESVDIKSGQGIGE